MRIFVSVSARKAANFYKHDGRVYALKIEGIPNDLFLQSVGRQIEGHKLKDFKDSAKTNHVSCKRKAMMAALKDWVKLYEAKEYYAMGREGNGIKDDSVEIFYKK